MLNVDGWMDGRTDGQTNGRKLARLCLPAKAGATKTLLLLEMIIVHEYIYYIFHLNFLPSVLSEIISRNMAVSPFPCKHKFITIK